MFLAIYRLEIIIITQQKNLEMKDKHNKATF